MSDSIRRVLLKLLLCVALVGCAQDGTSSEEGLEQSESPLATSELDFPVTLRATGSATLHATVYTSRNRRARDTLLAVHGFTESGTVFDRFAEQLFRTKRVRERIARVVAIDLIGHGGSSLPANLPAGARFGELTIDDNVSVVIQAIEALRARGLGAQVIVGHSMGGLTVQAVQEALLAQNSSLAALDIRRAILLAPVPPTGRPWVRPPSGDLSAFVKMTPELGSYFEIPTPAFIASSFSTLGGMLAPNAPTAEQVDARGYVAIEPLLTTLQLVEDPSVMPLKRPMVRGGAFSPAHGTALELVSFSQDTLVPASNLPDLYTYLTGDAEARGYVPIVADDAVHSMFISNPAAVVRPLRKAF